MNTPGSKIGSSNDSEGQEGTKFQLEGRDVKIPKPEDVQGLLSESVSLSDLRSRLESKYPGYTLPDEEFVRRVLGNKKLENLQKIRRATGFAGQYFSFLYSDSEGEVVRSERFDEAGSDIAMGSDDKAITTLQNSDNIFLVKAEAAPGGNH